MRALLQAGSVADGAILARRRSFGRSGRPVQQLSPIGGRLARVRRSFGRSREPVQQRQRVTGRDSLLTRLGLLAQLVQRLVRVA